MNVTESTPNVIDVIAEEFVERYRRGERPAIGEYEAKYPEQAEAIRELFPALVVMERLKPESKPVPTSSQAECASEVASLGRLGDYRIVREVGRGGMGIVYEAVQQSLGRKVALKVLPKQLVGDESRQARFDREARAAARLHHTNIVPVFGVGQESGLHYYAMQYIHGLSLDEVLRELRRLKSQGQQPSSAKDGSPVPPAEEPRQAVTITLTQALITGQFEAGANDSESRTVADLSSQPPDAGGTSDTAKDRLSQTLRLSDSLTLPGAALSGKSGTGRGNFWRSVARIGMQVSEALHYAHEQGVLHRDVKPSNLLLDTRGTVWVTDFGLAKADDQRDLTQTGDVLGTLRYMAPEMFSGKADRRSDVYSLGLTLYELLALRPAFDEADRGRLIRLVLNESPPRLRNLDPSIPRDLETILHKAIDREPSHRYASAQDLADDLTRFVSDEPIRARRVSLATRFSRWCKRNPAVAGLSAAIVLLLVSAAVLSGVQAVRFRNVAGQRQLALDEAIIATNKAKDAETAATKARNDEQTQREQLAQNVDLALEALEKVYLQFAEERLANETELNEADREFLQKALPFYEAFSRQKAADPKTKTALAKAATRVGSISRRLKQYEQAHSALSKALGLWESLLSEDARSLEFRGELAWVRRDLANTLREWGQLDQAESVYRQSLEEYAALLADAPEWHVVRRGIALDWRELGLIFEIQGKSDEARSAYKRSADELEQLTRRVPENMQYRHDLAYGLQMLGSLDRARLLGSTERDSELAKEAEATFVDAMQRYQELALAEPSRQDVAIQMAGGQKIFAYLLKEAGRKQEAIESFKESIEQYRKLVQAAPHDPVRRNELAQALNEMAGIYRWDLGTPTAAKAAWQEAAEIRETIIQWWPDNQAYQLGLAECLRGLADSCYALKQYAEARQHSEKALPILQRFVTPEIDGHWHAVSGSVHYWLAKSALALGGDNSDLVESHFTAAIAAQSMAAARRPKYDWDTRHLCNWQSKFGEFLVEVSRHEDAIPLYEQAIQSAQQLVQRFNTDHEKVGGNRWKLATALQTSGKVEEAREQVRIALDFPQEATICYTVRIRQPGRYRLFPRAGAFSAGSDSLYVRVPELADGPWGRQADWYFVDIWFDARGFGDFAKNSPFGAGSGGFEHRRTGSTNTVAEPMNWVFEKPGDYTLEFRMFEDGGSLDRFVLQLLELPDPDLGELAESPRTGDGVHLEAGGKVVVEAEHFTSRIDGADGVHQWRIVPTEHAGDGPRIPNHRGEGYVQILPDRPLEGLKLSRVPQPEFAVETYYQQLIRRWTDIINEKPECTTSHATRAKFHGLRGDHGAAAEDFSKCIELDGENPRWWHERCVAHWDAGQYDAALADIKAYSQKLKIDTGDDGHKHGFELGQFCKDFVLKRRPGAPRESYQRLIPWHQEALDLNAHFYTWTDLGVNCFRAGSYAEAIDYSLTSIAVMEEWALNNQHIGVFIRLGMIYDAAGDRETALKWHALLADWQRTNPFSFPDTFGTNAEAEAQLGPLADAGSPDQKHDTIELCTRLLELAPDTPWAYRLRSAEHRKAGREDEARADEERALAAYGRLIETHEERIAKGWEWPYLRRGHLLWELNRYAEARDDCTRAIELNPKSAFAWNLRGIQHNRLGGEQAALDDYSKAIELNPNNHVLRSNRASTYERMGRHAEAAEDYAQALQLKGDHAPALAGRALCYVQLQKYEQAIADWDRYLAVEAKDAKAWNGRGRAHYLLQHWQQAADDFGKAIELDAKTAPFYQNRAAANWKLARENEALADYAQWLALADLNAPLGRNLEVENQINAGYIERIPEEPRGWVHRAKLLANRGDHPQAEMAFGEALSRGGDDARLWKARGNYFLGQGRYQEALADFAKVVELDPQDHETWNRRTAAHSRLNLWKEAVADATQAIAVKPEHALYRRNRAYCYRQLALWDEAIADYAEWMDLEPGNATAWIERGLTHYMRRDFAAAEADLARAMELGASAATLSKQRAEVLVQLGRLDEAACNLSKCIDLDPRDHDAWNRRGVVHGRLGRWDEALADHGQAIELEPSVVLYRNNRAAAYGKLAKWQEALADHARAIELASGESGAWEGRGMTLLEMGDAKLARDDLSKALQLDAKNGNARYWLALLDLHEGGTASYRAHCAVLAEQGHPWAAWTCVLAPGALVDYGMLLDRAQQTAEQQPKDIQAWQHCGALACRAGKYEEAIVRLTTAARLLEENPSRETSPAYVWYFLGMAQQRLGKPDEAKTWFDRAAAETEQALSGHQSGKERLPWNRRVTLELLHKEAESLIAPAAPPAGAARPQESPPPVSNP